MSFGRLLLIDEDPQASQVARERLASAGFLVELLHEPTRAAELATQFAPQLICVRMHMRALSGAEVALKLRGNRATAAIPVIFLDAEPSIEQVIRVIRQGAIELLRYPLEEPQIAQLKAIWQELSASRRTGSTAPGRAARDLIAHFRRDKITGTLTVDAGGPTGRATFFNGDLRWAQLGPATGFPALEEMLLLDKGDWQFQEQPDPPKPVSQPVARYFPRVLLVDDEEALRRMFGAILKGAGMQVSTAEDGLAALEATRQTPFDLVLVDLNMPRLDGWGLLRALQTAHRTREIPVCVLTVLDDYRQTLSAARSGARAYLSKLEPSDELLKTVETLLGARKHAFETLASNQPLSINLQQVGTQWMLRAFGQLRVSGQLEAKDDWGRYTLLVDDGRLAEVTVRIGNKIARGKPALAALLVARDLRAQYSPGQIANLGARLEIEDSLDRACAALDALEEKVTDRRLREESSLVVDETLYELFFRVGSTKELVVARALCEQKIAPAKLASHLGISPEEVAAGLRELLRRQVVSFR